MEKKENENKENKQEEEINAMALVSYLIILFLVPLIAAKEDPFAQFHAKQGFVVFLIFSVGMFIGFMPLPYIGFLISYFIYLVWIIFVILGITNVLKNEKKELPIIGKYARKFKF
ncbi:MAG: hypothetical protein ACLFNN_01775 [Candidatus Paceibacterota bacterium]